MKHIIAISLVVALIFSIAGICAFAESANGSADLTALLSNLVQDVQPGTAGSSLKATARAADLMKWGMTTEMSDEEISSTVESIISAIPEEDKAAFTEVMSDIYGIYCSFLTDDCSELLESIGYNSADYDFSNIEIIEPLEAVMTAAGIIS